MRPARLVELPVGASEDRLVGSLDLERALTAGVKAFEPGLLAAAHRGVLYVDEVNLLHDHLVDLLLDAAAMGTAYVEREGVSVRHAARFLLVGTMNPEEGELRPQLLDRFGLAVDVRASRDPARAGRGGAPPARLRRRPGRLRRPLRRSRRRARRAHRRPPASCLPTSCSSDAALRQITSVCAAFDVDGLRADLVTARAAIALAAWDGRTEVDRRRRPHRGPARAAAPRARPRPLRRARPRIDEETLEQALAGRGDAGPDDRRRRTTTRAAARRRRSRGRQPEPQSATAPSRRRTRPAASRPAERPGRRRPALPYRAPGC